MQTKTKNIKDLCKEFGYNIYANEEVLKTIPEKQSGAIEIFTLEKYVTDDELEKEYISRGLIPADPYSVLEFHKDSDKKYIVTHWKDGEGKWCFAAFLLWIVGRRLVVHRGGREWRDGWWFAGLRKDSTKPLDTQNSGHLDPLSLNEAIKIVKNEGYKIYKEI